MAYHVALRARVRTAQRARRERPGVDAVAAAAEEAVGDDVRHVLDEEISRLPERYRAALALCCLEGATHAEAARQLGCRPETVSSRLTWARERLRARLVRRGVVLSAAWLGAAVTPDAVAAVPGTLAAATVNAGLVYAGGGGTAASGASVNAMGLTEGVLRAMWMTKLKMAACLLLVAIAAATGASRLAVGLRAAERPPVGKDTQADRAKQPDGGEADTALKVLQSKLEKRVDFNNAVAGPLMEFTGYAPEHFKGYLSERYELKIYFAEQDVRMRLVQLPKLKGVRLGTLLDLVANQVNGVCLMSKAGILIVPRSNKVINDHLKNGWKVLPAAPGEDAAKLKAKLDNVVAERFAIKPGTPLQEALAQFADHFSLNVVCETTFAEKEVKSIDRNAVGLKEAKGLRLSEVLESLCKQAKGTYRIQDNVIVVVPSKR